VAVKTQPANATKTTGGSLGQMVFIDGITTIRDITPANPASCASSRLSSNCCNCPTNNPAKRQGRPWVQHGFPDSGATAAGDRIMRSEITAESSAAGRAFCRK